MRQTPVTGGGLKPYGGDTRANEEVIASGLPASIQAKRERSRPDGGLPSEAYSRAGWNVFIRTASLGEITERDVIVDDLGKRYQVIAAYWNSLGYKITADLLQA
jgi:hypothetical protein